MRIRAWEFWLIVIFLIVCVIVFRHTANAQDCSRMSMTAVETAGGDYVMQIDGCASSIAALGTPEELAQHFATELDAHNYFLLLIGRLYHIVLAPIPQPE